MLFFTHGAIWLSTQCSFSGALFVSKLFLAFFKVRVVHLACASESPERPVVRLMRIPQRLPGDRTCDRAPVDAPCPLGLRDVRLVLLEPGQDAQLGGGRVWRILKLDGKIGGLRSRRRRPEQDPSPRLAVLVIGPDGVPLLGLPVPHEIVDVDALGFATDADRDGASGVTQDHRACALELRILFVLHLPPHPLLQGDDGGVPGLRLARAHPSGHRLRAQGLFRVERRERPGVPVERARQRPFAGDRVFGETQGGEEDRRFGRRPLRRHAKILDELQELVWRAVIRVGKSIDFDVEVAAGGESERGGTETGQHPADFPEERELELDHDLRIESLDRTTGHEPWRGLAVFRGTLEAKAERSQSRPGSEQPQPVRHQLLVRIALLGDGHGIRELELAAFVRFLVVEDRECLLGLQLATDPVDMRAQSASRALRPDDLFAHTLVGGDLALALVDLADAELEASGPAHVSSSDARGRKGQVQRRSNAHARRYAWRIEHPEAARALRRTHFDDERVVEGDLSRLEQRRLAMRVLDLQPYADLPLAEEPVVEDLQHRAAFGIVGTALEELETRWLGKVKRPFDLELGGGSVFVPHAPEQVRIEWMVGRQTDMTAFDVDRRILGRDLERQTIERDPGFGYRGELQNPNRADIDRDRTAWLRAHGLFPGCVEVPGGLALVQARLSSGGAISSRAMPSTALDTGRAVNLTACPDGSCDLTTVAEKTPFALQRPPMRAPSLSFSGIAYRTANLTSFPVTSSTPLTRIGWWVGKSSSLAVNTSELRAGFISKLAIRGLMFLGRYLRSCTCKRSMSKTASAFLGRATKPVSCPTMASSGTQAFPSGRMRYRSATRVT